MRVLMIGCGNMGGALLTRWVELPNTSFTIVDPATSFEDPRVKICRSADDIDQDAFDLMIVAVKPQMIADIVPDYLSFVAPDAAILSIAAGVMCKRLEAIVGERPIIRVMPNLPAEIGKGVSGIYFNARTPEGMQTEVRKLMQAAGEVVEVGTEDGLDRVTAIAGSGPGYVFEIARTYVEAAKQLGFEAAEARRLVLATIAGAIEMAAHSNAELEDMRNAVTSKAGTTEAGLNALNGDGHLSRLMEAATAAAYGRAVELR